MGELPPSAPLLGPPFPASSPSSSSLFSPPTLGGASTTNPPPSSNPEVGKWVAVREWVQCFTCNKWRKLPLGMPSETLPDRWLCEKNNWDASFADCRIPEEEKEEGEREMGEQ